ncbi:MAG: D-cysteine desulfhydrase family protein [Pseudomonadota bacterium]
MTLGCLDDLPVANICPDPTPLEPLKRLSAANGGAQIWVKRDDCHGLAFGGNKVRQLAYYFGEAVAQDADAVLITGAVQSNYCRLAAAYAAKLGMECHLQHEARVASNDALYYNSGNVLLDRMLGATLHPYPHGEDEAGADRALEEIADTLRQAGKKPYVIHLGPGHPPLGTLGYVACAREVLMQLDAAGVEIDHVAIPSGSGATHSGFLFGLRALGSQIPVTGYCVRRSADLQQPRIQARCAEIAKLLEIDNPVKPEDVVVNDRFLTPGYGQINLPTADAIRLAARNEALILDPVYTGKCMAGALNLAGTMDQGAHVLFIHTGGGPAIFAYANALDQVIA